MRDPHPSRRTFVKESAAAVAATAAAAQLSLLPNAHAAGSDTLRVGLVGCGSRGTGAAEQALTADKNVDIVAIETTYNSGGVWDPPVTREQVKSEMEYQMRCWYYYTWLGGDHIVEQAVHGIDTMAWAMRDEPPIRCWGSGGRQVRTDPKYGNIYDHFSVVYEYPNNVRGYHNCRHWKGTAQQTKDYVLGSKGFCDVFGRAP